MTDFLALTKQVEDDPEWFIDIDDAIILEAFDLAHRYQGNMETITCLTEQLAALQKALEPFIAVTRDYVDRGLDDDEHILCGRITRSGESSEPPRVRFSDLRALVSAATPPDLANQSGGPREG